MDVNPTPTFRYLLDTSALIAYLNNENGSDGVAQCRTEAAIPFIALSELYYVIWTKKNRMEADFIYGVVQSWKLPILLPNERVILSAGRFKGQYHLGIADSYIAAFAFERQLLLVTKDKDFRTVENEITVHWVSD
jgi:predicted nucleic acid-binding protein